MTIIETFFLWGCIIYFLTGLVMSGYLHIDLDMSASYSCLGAFFWPFVAYRWGRNGQAWVWLKGFLESLDEKILEKKVYDLSREPYDTALEREGVKGETKRYMNIKKERY